MTDSDIAFALHRANDNATAAAKALGCSRSTIYSYRLRLLRGGPSEYTKLAQYRADHVKQLAAAGFTIPAMSKRMSEHPSTIREIVKRHKIAVKKGKAGRPVEKSV